MITNSSLGPVQPPSEVEMPGPSPENPNAAATGDFFSLISQKISGQSSQSTASDNSSADNDLAARKKPSRLDSDNPSDINPAISSSISALIARPDNLPATPPQPPSEPKGNSDLDSAQGKSVPVGVVSAKDGSLTGFSDSTAAASTAKKPSAPNPRAAAADSAKTTLADTLTLKDAPPASADKSAPQVDFPESPPGKESQLQALTLDKLGMNPIAPPAGMPAALDMQSMKFASEKNEIAGHAVQKLPTSPAIGGSTDENTDKLEVKSISSLSGHSKELSIPVLPIDLSGKSNDPSAQSTHAAGDARAADNTTAQVERVARLVTQEAVMIKQSGATSLAVSLKLDPHTELFLQLTNHDGQIQASLRFERGSMAGLGDHWGQLQESLARQNIHLLPLEEKFSPRTPSEPGGRQFEQQAQNQQRPARDLPDESSAVDAILKPSSSRNTKNVTSGPRGWESWA